MDWYIWVCGVLAPFFISMILVFCVHPYIVRIAKERGLVDNPDARKLQKQPVPVLGGLAVFFGVVVGLGVTSMFFNSYVLFTSVVALTVMMYIGVLDDLMGLSPVLRIILEIAFIGFVAWMDQVNINDFHGAFGVGMLPVYLSAPLCAITGVGIINAINMIDGVDGLASGFCVMACIVFGTAFMLSFDGTMTVLAAVTAGALIPFFFHNVFGRESKMFIGDSGSHDDDHICDAHCRQWVACFRKLLEYGYRGICAVGVVGACFRHLARDDRPNVEGCFAFSCRQVAPASSLHRDWFLSCGHLCGCHIHRFLQYSLLVGELSAWCRSNGSAARGDGFGHTQHYGVLLHSAAAQPSEALLQDAH